MNDLPLRPVREHLVHENPWWQVWFDDVVFPSGEPGRHLRLLPALPRPGMVAMVCDDAGPAPVQVLLVRQWRYAQQAAMWEFPRGFAEAHDPDVFATVAREVLEETGVEVYSTEPLGSLCADSSIIGGQVVAVLVRTGVGRAPTDGEVHATKWVGLDELCEMIRTGAITDAYTLATVALYQATRPAGL